MKARVSPRITLAICVAVGGLAGYLIVPSKPAAAPDAPMPVVQLDGKPWKTTDADSALDEARTIAHAWLTVPIDLQANGKTFTKTREQLGARVDSDRLRAIVAQLFDGQSALRRKPPQNIPLPVSIDPSKAVTTLVAIKDDLDQSPVDAKLDFKTRAVTPDEAGLSVDVWKTLDGIDAAVREAKPLAVVTSTIPATRSAASIQNIEMDDVLGYFETKYARDLKHEARTFNLKLAASKFDGYVLMPGETFDFNDVVGPRSEARGYKVATVIAQGELVDGIGGGTCQVAGTLHGAAFFAGLEIPERKPHTRPSGYIKMGMDAAVAYPTVTLKLKNPYQFPVVLHEVVENGVVRAEILGPRRVRDVTFVRKIVEVTPFKEKEVNDDKVPKGEKILVQRGIPGFRVVRWRVMREGPNAVRERTQDQYPSTTQIWHVGTGEEDKKYDAEAHDDAHPEYVADEYLALSQGPHIRDPKTGLIPERGGATVESRIAGRYGLHGWMEKEGFAKESRRPKKHAGEDEPGVD